jgi:N-acetylglucosaminyldiphosphoundecaprenol N-acetyl-beta-D-mannosaminyltransferase
MIAEKIEIFGCNVDNLSLEETIKKIESIIRERTPKQHVVINAGKVNQIHKKPRLKEIINFCDIVNADGIAIVWASRFLGNPLKQRVAGIDLMMKLIEKSAEKQYRLYFLGAKEEVLKVAINKCLESYPNLNIVGYRNGYWRPEQELDVVEKIKAARPDILFVGISSPKKEEFLNKYLTDLNAPFSMGVGGSFDILADKTSRAPQWLQNIGLEWAYRLLQEPRRLWKRYLIGNILFCWLVLKEKFR